MHSASPVVRRIAALIAVAGAAAACSSGASKNASSTARPATATLINGVQHVTVHATDRLRFSPDTLEAHPGKLQLTLVDDGSYPHNISLPSLHLTSQTVSGNPGQKSTTITLTLSQPGTYQFVCTYHSSAGMRGQLVVK